MKNQINAKILLIAISIAVVFMITFRANAQTALPAPDFSEMEKDYEIVKWSYEGYHIKLLVKPKTEPPHSHNLGFKFFDEDGATVDGPLMILNLGSYTPTGTVERGEAALPDQSKFKRIKSVIVYWVQNDGTLVGPNPPEPPKNNATGKNSADAKNQPAANDKIDAADNNQSGAKCDYAALPSTSSFPEFSVALAQAGIYERYGFNKDENISYGVNFLEVTPLGSFKNTVTVMPGRGAQRKQGGAPVGATIYRFHAKYIVCLKYSDSTVRTQYESDNVCFKAQNGGWDCPVDSAPEITELN